MAKDTTSQHVWRILMLCAALGAGALLIVIGYLFGAKLAMNPEGTPMTPGGNTIAVPSEESKNPEEITAVQGSIFENGGSLADKLTVTWFATAEQVSIALPFTIPGVTEDGVTKVTPDVTTGTRLGTAKDARGQEWQIVAIDVQPYNEMGGAIEGGVMRYFVAQKGEQWTVIAPEINVVKEAAVAWQGWARSTTTFRDLLAQRLGDAGKYAEDAQITSWLVQNKVTEGSLWIPEYSLAKMIAGPSGLPALIQDTRYEVQGELLAEAKKLPVVATLEDGAQLRMWVQEDPSQEFTRLDGHITANTYYALTERNILIRYTIDIPVYSGEGIGAGAGSVVIQQNGAEKTATYTSVLYGGCGIRTEAVLRTGLRMEDLVVLGTANGETLYTARDPQQNTDFTSAYAAWSNWQKSVAAYDGTTANTSWETFLASNPLFYWKNAMGQWMLFSSSEVVPLAECGKPVIYLYPEETTDINVQLYLQGGFTASVPPYGEKGWSVTAAPDGTLVNHADGLQYPYLFWEGFGSAYPQTEYFDVVARDDVPMYLINTLWNYGLNQTELRDFMEFWLPRMQAARYYKIHWIDTESFNQLAPLSLSKSPDSLLRILMEYEELTEPVASNPMPTPERLERDGFTVVEWGGVLKSSGSTPQRAQ